MMNREKMALDSMIQAMEVMKEVAENVIPPDSEGDLMAKIYDDRFEEKLHVSS